MKITLARSAGFCFGVKRALHIASEIAKKQKNVEMLGEIVHNEIVVKEIERSGIKKIKRLSAGKGKTLLIRAHGAGRTLFKRARTAGYAIADATCPMVKEIHKIALENEKAGYKIIIIGDALHDEVKGILGQLKRKALVIDSSKTIPLSAIKKIKKACAIVQSTQNINKVMKIFDTLKKYIPDFTFHNTICRPTRIKQEEIKTMPLENDCMIIIGSKTSANTRRLYEISRSLNKRSYWVNTKNELKTAWFHGITTVGVTAGASTPDSSTQEIISRIKEIA